MNYIEFVSENAANELQDNYVETAPSGFLGASILTFLRTGAITATLTSVYPSREAFEASAIERKKRMSIHADKIQAVRIEEGEAALAFTR